MAREHFPSASVHHFESSGLLFSVRLSHTLLPPMNVLRVYGDVNSVSLECFNKFNQIGTLIHNRRRKCGEHLGVIITGMQIVFCHFSDFVDMTINNNWDHHSECSHFTTKTVPTQHGEHGRQQLGPLPNRTIVTLCLQFSLPVFLHYHRSSSLRAFLAYCKCHDRTLGLHKSVGDVFIYFNIDGDTESAHIWALVINLFTTFYDSALCVSTVQLLDLPTCPVFCLLRVLRFSSVQPVEAGGRSLWLC